MQLAILQSYDNPQKNLAKNILISEESQSKKVWAWDQGLRVRVGARYKLKVRLYEFNMNTSIIGCACNKPAK